MTVGPGIIVSHNISFGFCRRGTKLVLAASVTFLLLMFPRGVCFMVRTYTPRQQLIEGSTDELVLAVDEVLSWFQYLNHSINFFIYVLINKNLRFCTWLRGEWVSIIFCNTKHFFILQHSWCIILWHLLFYIVTPKCFCAFKTFIFINSLHFYSACKKCIMIIILAVYFSVKDILDLLEIPNKVHLS